MSRANGKVNWPGWETVKVIGAGSFGTVYEIQRDVFGKTERAALKVISVPQDTNEVEELYNEGYDDVSITAHLKECMEDIVKEYSLMLEIRGHSNIVYCEDLQYFPHEDGIGWDIFIKMELLTPLTKAFGNIYDEKQAIKLGIDMCRALKFCKQKNIIHRDIKPQNIFVSPSGDYKLGDFGIAKISDKTAGGTKVGTYEYMAPEIYNNQPYGTSSDLYSVGMVMYWAMNERRGPFLPLPPQIPTGSMKEEAYRRRFAGEALPKPAHGSERLWNIVSSACQFEPKNRYTSPDSLLSDLEALCNGTADHQNENSGTRQTHQSTAQQSQAYLEAYREKRITAATVAVFFDKEGIDLRGDHFAMTRIRNISRDARVFLDQNPEKLVNIKLSKITAKGTGPIDLNVNLSRETTGYDCRTGEEARIEQNLFDAVVADAKKYHQIDIMWSPLAVLRLWLIVGKGRKSLETENGVNISMPGLPTPQGPKDLKTVIAREVVYGGNTPPKPPGGKSFNEIFGDLFGKAGVKFSSGTTIEKELSVTLKESILGAKKDITVERNEHCGNCNGNGCAQCGGTGAVKKTQKIKINIPAGIATGQSVRFAGQGNCGKNGDPNGDLMIKITVLPDKTFTRKGADIHTTLSVPAAKAKRGGSIMVQTIYGWTNIKLPAKVETGRVFTIKGRGAPDIKDPNIKGDHIFTVVVE